MSPRPSEPTRHEQLSLPLIEGYKVSHGEWPSVWGEPPAEYTAAIQDGQVVDDGIFNYAPPWSLIYWSLNEYDAQQGGGVYLIVPKIFETCKLVIQIVDGAWSDTDAFEEGVDVGADRSHDFDYIYTRVTRTDGYMLWYVRDNRDPNRVYTVEPEDFWGNKFTGPFDDDFTSLDALNLQVKAIWWTED